MIFDMDGVIVHNDFYHCESWKQFAGSHGFEVSHQEVKSWFGNTNPMILKNLFGENLDKESIKRMSDEKEKLYREIYTGKVEPLIGLAEFLKSAIDHGWTLAIATSAPPENVKFILNETGLGSFFHETTDASEIRKGKPDPEIFLLTAAKIGIDPGNCIVFEDSFYGIEAGKRAGMNVVAVATTHEAVAFTSMEYVIRDFSEIHPETLRKWIEK